MLKPVVSGLSVPGFKDGTRAHSLWGALRPRNRWPLEGSPWELKGDVLSVGGWGQWGKTLGPSWSARGEPSAPSGSEAQALGGCEEGEQERMHRFLRCRSEEQGVKAWFLRPPYSTPERAPTGRGVQREGQTQGPGARAG